MSQIQTLASGTPLISKYDGLGGVTGRNLIAPPGLCFGMIISRYGAGKSAFLQSNSDLFVINIDGSSTTCPGCPATIWPYVDPATGMVVGDDGRPVLLNIDLIQGKIDRLLALSRENKPRPKTVAIDSYTTLIPLLQQWIEKKAQKSWKEIHGPAAWDDLYNWLMNTMLNLHNAGYGVIIAAHVVTGQIPMGVEGRLMPVAELNAAPGFYKRIMGIFEWVAEITKEEVVTQVPDARFPGTNRTIDKREPQAFLRVNSPELTDICKYRVTIPDKFPIPLGRGWSTFERIYNEAAAKIPTSPPKE